MAPVVFKSLAQATGQRDQAPHFDSTRGDGPQPHNPSATSNHSGGAPAHFESPRGDGPQPHRPDGVASQSPSGAPAHFDATQGGGQPPHAPGPRRAPAGALAAPGAPVTARDVQFAKGMTIHHQAALDLARA